MIANVKKSIRLNNLTYGDLIENLSHVCYGVYHLPNNDDTCTAINNELSFINWKNRMMCRYPNAAISFDENATWSRKIMVVDKTFEYDKTIFLAIKSEYIKSESVYT